MYTFTFPSRKNGFIILLIIIYLAGLSFSAACTTTNNLENSLLETKPMVSATIFPIYDLVRQIVDGKMEVNLIVQPNDSPHTYNPSVQERVRIEKSRLIFIIGHTLDSWAIKGISNKVNIVVLDKGIDLITFDEEKYDEHAHGEVNPHYWLDPENASLMAQVIADELSVLDPLNKDFYQKNARELRKDLTKLLDEMIKLLKPIQSTPFITLHDAWPYFGKAFDLQIKGSFEPTAANQPTPRYLKELQEIIYTFDIKAIFSEPQLSTSSLDSFVKDNNLSIGTLDPIGSSSGIHNYQELIRFNCRELLQTLKNDIK
jgi:zinc transport system substrate-binding protein